MSRIESGVAALQQGEFLAGLDPRPDAVLLQEVRRSIEPLCESAGLDWYRLAVDVRLAEPADTPVRQRGVAIAGRGVEPTAVGIVMEAPLPERTLHALMQLDGREVRVATYHAPPGVSWLERKPQQAVAFAAWLGTSVGPVILGADANTPLVDHPDFALTRTHWHTGDRHLRGAPGDDCLWAATKAHGLRDALRRWLDDHPDDLAAIVRDRPAGPLAISHYTGRRKAHRGTPRRFDSIW